jgi:hypothetical protein
MQILEPMTTPTLLTIPPMVLPKSKLWYGKGARGMMRTLGILEEE